ncbi:MAG TPA: sugar ABC transporter permease [Armatimonadota bacterium]|jgi:multiple sugar transport system permease protein
MTKTERRHFRNGLLFTAPGIIGLLMFTVYPVAASLYYSFCNYSALTPAHWTGLNNYRLLMLDGKLRTALWNTVQFGAMSVPLGILTAFVLANLLNQKVRAMPLFRTIFYLPSVVPAVAGAVLWLWILNPQFGLLNVGLMRLGVANPPGWLADPEWARKALAIMGMWGVGGWMIIFLAGLQDVPVELHEAARLDGASPFQAWRLVTVPFMTPHLFFASVMGLIGVSSFFAQPMVMTGGGPADSTLFFAQYLFQNAFQFFKMGYACAMAWALGIVLMILTALFFRGSSKYVYYGGD